MAWFCCRGLNRIFSVLFPEREPPFAYTISGDDESLIISKVSLPPHSPGRQGPTPSCSHLPADVRRSCPRTIPTWVPLISSGLLGAVPVSCLWALRVGYPRPIWGGRCVLGKGAAGSSAAGLGEKSSVYHCTLWASTSHGGRLEDRLSLALPLARLGQGRSSPSVSWSEGVLCCVLLATLTFGLIGEPRSLGRTTVGVVLEAVVGAAGWVEGWVRWTTPSGSSVPLSGMIYDLP